MSMQINNYYNPSFSGTPLFSVQLKGFSKENKVVDAFVSKMDHSDFSGVIKDQNRWAESSLGKFIIADFLCKISAFPRPDTIGDIYLAIEAPKFNDKKIRGLAEISSNLGHETIELNLLQSANELEDEVQLRGAASCLIYAIAKFAQVFKKSSIYLKSFDTSEFLYNRLGFKPHYHAHKATEFTLSADKFDDFTKRLEEKYDIKPLTDLARTLY